MSATYAQARDDIITMFKDAWDPTGWTAVYDDVAADIPTGQDPWARVALRHNGGNQASLSGANSTQRFDRQGVLMVQIFTPTGEGLSRADQLAKIVSDAYEGSASPLGVWFRNVSNNEVGPDGDWFQTNVTAEFMYDEIK